MKLSLLTHALRWFVPWCLAAVANAGPPYATDDPQPTDFQHIEAYVFGTGTSISEGSSGAMGVDFNVGALPDLQLTVVAPIEYNRPRSAHSAKDVGNIELAAKYRFAHQHGCGWDISVFPRWILPSVARSVGERHHGFQLPLWLEKDFGRWSTFGGGGVVIHRGDGVRDYTLVGWAITRQVLPKLQLGVELFHRSADAVGALPSTSLNAGVHYALSDHFHLLGAIGPGIQNAAQTNDYSWYLALLITR